MESHLLLLSDGLIQGMCMTVTIFVHVLTFGFCNCNLQTKVLQSLSPRFAVVPGVPHSPAVPQCVGGMPPPMACTVSYLVTAISPPEATKLPLTSSSL